MAFVTTSKHNSRNYKQVEVSCLLDVAKIATTKPQQNWSCGIFKENYRNLDNFQKAYFIGLDVDEGATIEEAVSVFNKYAHCIVTSKSHNKEKNGVVADRYRIILKLEEPITDHKHFYATWQRLYEIFPVIDTACKDASRMWYTGNEIVHVQEEGLSVPVCKEERNEVEPEELTEGDYGSLSKLTNNFLEFGAAEGTWNRRLFKAAKDMQEQGYSKEDATKKLRRAALNFSGDLDNRDMETINSAFKNQAKFTKRSGHFVWERVDTLTDSEDVEWLIDGVLSLGGLGLIAGRAGKGKSTLTRQLAYCVCTGTKFLDRQTTKGAVLHITLEETRQILKQEATAQGLRDVDNYYIHLKPVNLLASLPELEQAIVDKGAKLLIIDSLIRSSGDLDINQQNDVNRYFAPVQNMADRTDCSVLIVHHQNKSSQGQDSIAGSYAISAAGEMMMVFEGEGRRRFITTTKTRGGKKWEKFAIEYNDQKRWYEPSDYKQSEEDY